MGGSDLVGDFKLVKWIKGIEFVADFRDIGSGYGGYSEDHKYFGRHQTLSRRDDADLHFARGKGAAAHPRPVTARRGSAGLRQRDAFAGGEFSVALGRQSQRHHGPCE
jgi:hypothetical protein